MNIKLYLILVLLIGCRFTNNLANGRMSWSAPVSEATEADALARQGRYQEALAKYDRHMRQRANDPRRPSDENPAFYHLLIGDMYLKLDNPNAASESYSNGEQGQVDKTLVIDRYRKLADYYVEKKKWDAALKVLKKHRKLDPDIFDADIDAMHKQNVKEEIGSAQPQQYQY